MINSVKLKTCENTRLSVFLKLNLDVEWCFADYALFISREIKQCDDNTIIAYGGILDQYAFTSHLMSKYNIRLRRKFY